MEKLKVVVHGDSVDVEEERNGYLKFTVESGIGEEGAHLDRDGVVLLTKFLERWLGVQR